MDAKLLHTLAYELERWLAAGDEETERHRGKLAKCAAELASQAAPPEQAALKRLVNELRDALGDGRVPANLVQLQRELQRVRQSKPAAPTPKLEPVAEARALLAGRALLVIGGLPRPEHKENLRTSFALSEVIWPETSEANPTLTVLEPHIARADVAAVVLLIRWIRHNLNDVAALCTRYGKPLVRAPGGYNVNQIAQLVVEQNRRRSV